MYAGDLNINHNSVAITRFPIFKGVTYILYKWQPVV